MLSAAVTLASVRAQWEAMTEDARATLDCALCTGLSPGGVHKVTRYSCHRRMIGGIALEIHSFCIGYACFTIATHPVIPSILCKMTLDDGFPLYAAND
jgi:hypothetical protein